MLVKVENTKFKNTPTYSSSYVLPDFIYLFILLLSGETDSLNRACVLKCNYHLRQPCLCLCALDKLLSCPLLP